MAGLLEDLGERSLRLSDDMTALANDEINAGEMFLRGLGETMGGVGDAVGVVTEPILGAIGSVIGEGFDELPESTQEYIKQGATDMMNGVLDTGPVKYATTYFKNHPRAARNISMAANAAELLPWGRLATGGTGDIMNAGIMETPTDLPGFYAGPAGAVKAFGKGVASGAPTALKTAVSPQMRAQRREVGTGQNRVDEFLTHEKQGTQRGAAVASSYIGKQIDDRVDDQTIMDYLPTVRSEIKHIGRAGDKESTMRAFTQDAPDMPDHIAEKFYERNTRALDQNYGLLGSVLPKVSNVGKQGEKLHVVRNLDAPGSDLRPEMVAQGQVGGRALHWMRNSDMLDRHAARIGRPVESVEDVKHYLTTASAFERGRWEALKKGLPGAYKNQNKSSVFEKYMNAKHAKGDALTPKQRASHEMTLARLADGEKLPKTVRKQHNDRLAKLEQGILTDEKKALIKSVDDYLETNKPNIAVDPDDANILWYTTSYTSTAQELGGVGQRMAIDTRNSQIYNSVLDGHDMFGMDPAKGVGLDTLVPPKQMGYGKSHVELKTSDKALKDEWEMMEQLGKKTGIPPKVEYYKVGPKKGTVKKTENVREYERRVLREYKAKATLGDYAGAANNVASMGLLVAPNSEVQDEARGY